MLKIVVVFILLVSGEFVLSQEIGKSWEFNEADNFEGIVLGNSFQDSSVDNGVLRAKISGPFPSLSSDTFNIDASIYGYIQIRIKIPGATSGKIMWDNDLGNWGYQRFIASGDTAFQQFDLPVFQNSQWEGKITKIKRLDFNPTIGSQIEIDYIRIVRIGVKPTILNFTPIRTIIKPNKKIPFIAIVKNNGDIEAELNSKLTLPDGVTLFEGSMNNNHGLMFNEVTDTLNWSLMFAALGEYNIGLKLYSETDTTEKVISLNVTDQYWDQKNFMLSAWSPPYAWYPAPYEDTVFTYYKNANFDNALWVRDDDALIQKVHQFGLNYFLLITPIIGELFLRAPNKEIPPDITEEMLQLIDEAVDKYKDDPNLLGYHICDEPHKQAFPNIGKVIERIRKKDPTKLSFVNIWPSGEGYREYIDELLQTTKLELLSYDRYHFFNGYDGGEYFSNLSVIREYALKYEIPFCNIIQAIGTNGTVEEDLNWRTPSESEHRWLVYSSLTYGVHALIWFHWHLNWGLTGNPDKEIIYPSIQNINSEIDSLKNIMVQLNTTGVYHTNISDNNWKLPKDGAVSSVSNDANLLVGYFKDLNDNENYFMLMNKDYSNGISTKVVMNYLLDSLQYFDVTDDKWKNMEFDNSSRSGEFNISLRKGGGKLLKFKGKKIVSVSESAPISNQFKLLQNYPNPFNPTTTIKYSIPLYVKRNAKSGFSTGGVDGDNVTLKIYDVLGREVANLVDKEQKPGNYQVQFDASLFSSGVYYYKLQTMGYSQSRKMILLK